MSKEDSAGKVLEDPAFQGKFIMCISQLFEAVAAINRDNGWRDLSVSKGERIALIHSECSELLEWCRKPKAEMSDHIPDFTGEAEELADVLIRVIDYSEIYNVPLASAVIEKLLFNQTRSKRHGGKRL